MARITVEDCLTKENNRFALVQLAAKRTKQLLGGAKVLVASSNKAVVTALREIASGQVRFMTQEETEEALLQQEAEKQAIFEEPIPIIVPTATNIKDILGEDDDDEEDEEEELADSDDDDDDDSDEEVSEVTDKDK